MLLLTHPAATIIRQQLLSNPILMTTKSQTRFSGMKAEAAMIDDDFFAGGMGFG